jgi:hypothetical protein
MSWVLEAIRGLRPTERLVLLVLANYADAQNATCWPSLNKLADQCEVRKETVKRALRRLEAAGLIATDERFDRSGRQTSNLYILQFTATTDRDVPPTETTPPRGAQTTGGRGAKKTPPTTLNRKKNPKKKQLGDAVPIPENLKTAEFLSCWSEWLEFRREKRKPVSARAAKIQLRKLSEIGPVQACATIDQSIQNDWQGLFPDKVNGSKRERHHPDIEASMNNYGWGPR